ncbi:hypothetical protein MRX96_005324 [Rhipicephalus microplus]
MHLLTASTGWIKGRRSRCITAGVPTWPCFRVLLDDYRPYAGHVVRRDNGGVTQCRIVAAALPQKPAGRLPTLPPQKGRPAYLVLFIDARSCVKFPPPRARPESWHGVFTLSPTAANKCKRILTPAFSSS